MPAINPTVRKLEAEITLVRSMISDNLKEHQWLRAWKDKLQEELDKIRNPTRVAHEPKQPSRRKRVDKDQK